MHRSIRVLVIIRHLSDKIMDKIKATAKKILLKVTQFIW